MSNFYRGIGVLLLMTLVQACQSENVAPSAKVLNSSIVATPPIRATSLPKQKSEQRCDAFMGYEKRNCLNGQMPIKTSLVAFKEQAAGKQN